MNGQYAIALVLIAGAIIGSMVILYNAATINYNTYVPTPPLIEKRLHDLCVVNHDKFVHEAHRLRDEGYYIVEYGNCNVTVIQIGR